MSGRDRGFRVLNWIGIINQLATTRANRVMAAHDLPMTQFVMLNHFSHRPDEGKTVGRIAAAFQQPQPGVTKTVQKLVERGYLEPRPNPADGRSRLLYLTPEGAAAHRAAIAALGPDLDRVFAGWSDKDLRRLFDYLDRLKLYLDRNR